MNEGISPLISKTDERGSTISPSRPVTVHDVGHARTALSVAAELKISIILQSAPGAALYLGPSFFQEFVTIAAEEFPEAQFTVILDCGNDVGAALIALKTKAYFDIFKISGHFNSEAESRLQSIASQTGSEVIMRQEPSLDLLALKNPIDALKKWLTS